MSYFRIPAIKESISLDGHSCPILNLDFVRWRFDFIPPFLALF